MDFTFTRQLHYLIHVVDDEHVAHCLDMDLVGTGVSEKESIEQLNIAVRSMVLIALKTGERLSAFKKAPERYYKMFDQAAKSGTRTSKVDISPEFAPVTVKECYFTYCLAVAA